MTNVFYANQKDYIAQLNKLWERATLSLTGQSTSSVTIGTGDKSFTADTDRQWAVNQPVVITPSAATSKYMSGTVKSYNSTTGALVVTVTSVVGSGTYSSWTITIGGSNGAQGISVTGGTINGSGHLILTLSDSSTIDAGYVKGTNGSDGTSITSLTVNGSGHLIVTLSTGATVDAGYVTGAQGAKGVNPTGNWNSAAAYAVDDLAYYSGSTYRRIVAGTTATNPSADTTNWQIFAQKGADGAGGVSTVNNVAPVSGNVTLTKSDLSLGNVDNTSDANKPVSTATQTALNLKAPLASPSFTGTATFANDFKVVPTASAVNYVGVTGAVAGTTTRLYTEGTDLDINLLASSKGTGAFRVFTNGVAQEQFRVSHVASAVNYIQATGNGTGFGPGISAQGSDPNAYLQFNSKGTGSQYFATGSGTQFSIVDRTSVANRLFTQGGATANAAIIGTTGTDPNITFEHRTQGTGAHYFTTNGGAQTQLVVAHTSSAVNYDQITGGAAGTGTYFANEGSDAAIQQNLTCKGASSVILRTGGSVAQLVASHTASAVNYVQISGSAAGSRVTHLANGSDTDVGVAYTGKGAATHAFGGSGGNQFVINHIASAVNYAEIYGAATGGSPEYRSNGSDPNAGIIFRGRGTGSLDFKTGGGSQFVIANTASAVNYTQVTGGATGTGATYTVAGSDAAIDLLLVAKGAGLVKANGSQVITAATLKTINGSSLVGSGDLVISSGPTAIAVQNKTATYTVVASDLGKVINSTAGTYTINLTAAATLGAGFYCYVWNSSDSNGDVITVDPNGAETIDGMTTLKLQPGEGFMVVCDGTNWYVGAKKPMRMWVENAASSMTRPQATGLYSFAIGRDAQASGSNSVAIGCDSTPSGARASGNGAIAIGGANAQGANSFAAAINSNSTTYGAQSNNSVAIGYLAKASNTFALAMSQSAVASGTNSVAIGQSNTASGANALAIGGYQNTASQSYSIAMGYGAASNIIGKLAFSSTIFTSVGDSQAGKLILRKQTNDGTAGVMTTDAGAASTTNQVILPNDSTFIFRGQLVARNTSNDADSKVWEFKGAIRRGTSAATTALIGTPVIDLIASDGSAWSVALTADTTNGGLAVTVTGEAAKTIKWACTIDTTEVTG